MKKSPIRIYYDLLKILLRPADSCNLLDPPDNSLAGLVQTQVTTVLQQHKENLKHFLTPRLTQYEEDIFDIKFQGFALFDM